MYSKLRARVSGAVRREDPSCPAMYLLSDLKFDFDPKTKVTLFHQTPSKLVKNLSKSNGLTSLTFPETSLKDPGSGGRGSLALADRILSSLGAELEPFWAHGSKCSDITSPHYAAWKCLTSLTPSQFDEGS